MRKNVIFVNFSMLLRSHFLIVERRTISPARSFNREGKNMFKISKIVAPAVFALVAIAAQSPAQASMAGMAGNALQSAVAGSNVESLTTEIGGKRHRRVHRKIRRHRRVNRHRRHHRRWNHRRGYVARDYCIARELWGLHPTRRCRLHYRYGFRR